MVERYDCTSGGSQFCYGCYSMEVHDEGDWVRYEDHKVTGDRYEYVRKLTPQQFAEIYQENLSTGKSFDSIIDERITDVQ
jgi:hypothetical protein